MDGDDIAAQPDEPQRSDPTRHRPRTSTSRAAGNATDVALGYGLAAARAGVTAAIGLGKAAVQITGQVVEKSPVGKLAASAADALEPAAERARQQRTDSTAEATVLIEAIVERITSEVVSRLDVDGIVRQVDVDDIIRRVDVDEIVKRVDVDDVVRRVDVDEIVARVDVDEIMARTELGSVIVQSTTGVATEALDVVRSQGVGLDNVVTRVTDRVLRRGRGPRPTSPPLLAPAADDEPLELPPVDEVG